MSYLESTPKAHRCPVHKVAGDLCFTSTPRHHYSTAGDYPCFVCKQTVRSVFKNAESKLICYKCFRASMVGDDILSELEAKSKLFPEDLAVGLYTGCLECSDLNEFPVVLTWRFYFRSAQSKIKRARS